MLQRTVQLSTPIANAGETSVAVIGSGNYATAVLIPAFRAAGARLRSVASSGGVSGVHAGRKFGFEETTTDTASIFSDKEVNTVAITTRHDSHAALVCQALQAGKHVFVEKPLALTMEALSNIEAAWTLAQSSDKKVSLMVGFNRRFAPQIVKIKSLLTSSTGPKSFVMTVNAGAIPADHWTQDREIGGGRLIGEACHFIDLLRFLAGTAIVNFTVAKMDTPTGDTVSIGLHFGDGSVGTVHYFANGSKSFPKERLEVFSGGRVLQLDNFRKLTGFGWPGFGKMNLWRQDKGQKACTAAFVQAIEQGDATPIPIEEIFEVARVTIAIAQKAAG